MAKVNFRTAVFGFNKDEVNLHLLKLQQDFALKEQNFLKKLEHLEIENKELKEKFEKTENEFNETRDEFNRMSGEYDRLKSKEQEIEQISESIGTMYMVAMQNAQDIMADAENCAAEINKASAIRLEAAIKAEEQLNQIKDTIKNSADRLVEDINSMSLSLDAPKSILAAQLEKKGLPEIQAVTDVAED